MAAPAQIRSDTIVIEVDSLLGETVVMANTVTDHPVEEGAAVSDHSRAEPNRLHLDCVVTNTPFSRAQRALSTQDGKTAGEIKDRGKIVLAQLQALRDQGALLQIITALSVYENMTLESIQIIKDAKSANGLHFQAGFKTIKIVQNKLTRSNAVTKAGAGKKVKKGEQTPKPVEIQKSHLAAAADSKGIGNKLKALFDGKDHGVSFNVEDGP